MSEVEGLIREHIRDMESYQPVYPFEVVARQLGKDPQEIVKLNANENPYGPHPAVEETLRDLRYVHIYPDPECRLLREALARQLDLPIENLLVGSGADELIDLIMRLFLDPGDVLLNCPPTFGMYAFDAGVNDTRLIDVPRKADFSLDLSGIERAVVEHEAKLLFLASPNNPDGGVLPGETLDRILELPLVVVVDEAYVQFADPGSSRMRAVLDRQNLIVLQTFSKWAGLAGLRVGYGVFPEALMPYLWKIKQPYNVSVAGAAAALTSLRHIEALQENVAKIVAERRRVYAILEEIPFLQPYPSQTNFILCQVIGRPAAELRSALEQAGILVRYYDKPRLRDHIRISVGTPTHSDALFAALAAME
jgi:histidinol-phosphate aminotransferase